MTFLKLTFCCSTHTFSCDSVVLKTEHGGEIPALAWDWNLTAPDVVISLCSKLLDKTKIQSCPRIYYTLLLLCGDLAGLPLALWLAYSALATSTRCYDEHHLREPQSTALSPTSYSMVQLESVSATCKKAHCFQKCPLLLDMCIVA